MTSGEGRFYNPFTEIPLISLINLSGWPGPDPQSRGTNISPGEQFSEDVTVMSLEERLMADMKEAMRRREEVRVSAIRMVRAALTNEAIDKRRPLSEDEAVAVLSRQVKQRRESIEAFTAGNRPDLVAREQQELDVLLAYMPRQMTQDEIVQAARATIQEVGAAGPTDFGKVMSRLAPALKGKADGKLIGDVVRKLLSGQETE